MGDRAHHAPNYGMFFCLDKLGLKLLPFGNVAGSREYTINFSFLVTIYGCIVNNWG
jgi:hypothetical protein